MDCLLIGLRVVCDAHNGEHGKIVHVCETNCYCGCCTKVVVLFDDGHILEFGVDQLVAEPVTPGA